MSTQSSGTSPKPSGQWFAAFPLPVVITTPRTYRFMDVMLEARVFTHPSFGNGTHPHNAILAFEGGSLVSTLATLNLTSLFPTESPSTLYDLRLAATSRSLHAHLSRLLSLSTHLRVSRPEMLSSERLQAELFEVYIAGIFRELGAARMDELQAYHMQLLEPFMKAYKELHQSAAHTAALHEKARKQELAMDTMRLMEYAAKHKLESPVFDFSCNGEPGAQIRWACQVVLGGIVVAKAVASNKSIAKHLASGEALKALPQSLETKEPAPTPTVERRKKKEHFRMAAKARSEQPVFGQPDWTPPVAVPASAPPDWNA